ncbi:MAG: hypothetical protein VKJ66_03885 [Synechococcus sp.]|nr:hypothetical protein [Synechococcus sp.]
MGGDGNGEEGWGSAGRSPRALRPLNRVGGESPAGPSLPPLPAVSARTSRSEGTNVVRVPFGVRQPRRRRPERPDHWATLVLPFQAGGSTPPPPQAA